MQAQLNKILEEAKAQLKEVSSLAQADEIRVKVLGKKGKLTEILRGMGKLSPEERKSTGQIANKVRAEIEQLLEMKFNELKKAAKQKNKNTCVCKEIQLKTNISLHDLEIKANKAKEFLNNGNKVKVVLTMKGRELGRRELSKDCFNKFIELTSDTAVFDSVPKDEGNKVICILKKR